jgi:hypothetical protein
MLMYLYYTHSEEMTQVLTAHPALSVKAAALAKELIPSLQSGLQNNSAIVLTGDQYNRMLDILRGIREKSSPRLAGAITFVLKKLASPEQLEKTGVLVRH